jgi:hypothetical protein
MKIERWGAPAESTLAKRTEEGSREREPSETELRPIMEWVALIHHEFQSIDAPCQQQLNELLQRHPESEKLINDIALTIKMSAAKASGAARELARIDEKTWFKGVHRAYG